MQWYSYDIRDMDEQTYACAAALMSEDKRRRVADFRFTEDKKRTVAGDMLARAAAAAHCGVAPEKVVIAADRRGAPYAVGLPVCISISHAGDLAVCAADDTLVGIDVERIRPIHLRVARRVFDKATLQEVFGHPPNEADYVFMREGEVLTRFYLAWTRYEAGVKLGAARCGAEILESRCILAKGGEAYALSILRAGKGNE